MIVIKFDKAIRPLVLMIPKVSGYVKTFKVKEEQKDKRYMEGNIQLLNNQSYTTKFTSNLLQVYWMRLFTSYKLKLFWTKLNKIM